MITHVPTKENAISKDYGDVKIRLSGKPGSKIAFVDVQAGTRWIFNCTLVKKGETLFLNPPTIFNKDLKGMAVAELDGQPHTGWVVLNDFRNGQEKRQCFKKVVAAYFRAVSSLIKN